MSPAPRARSVFGLDPGAHAPGFIESPTGTFMRVGVSADTARFESELLEVLNGTEGQGHP